MARLTSRLSARRFFRRRRLVRLVFGLLGLVAFLRAVAQLGQIDVLQLLRQFGDQLFRRLQPLHQFGHLRFQFGDAGVALAASLAQWNANCKRRTTRRRKLHAGTFMA
jgi:hypothetical protein